MTVRDIMRRALVTILPDVSKEGAVESMRTHQVRHLIVTDEVEQLIGILTDPDVRRAAFLPMLARHLPPRCARLGAPCVRDVMTCSVATIAQDVDLERAALLMFERRIGSLPVTEDGRVVGVLTDTATRDRTQRTGGALSWLSDIVRAHNRAKVGPPKVAPARIRNDVQRHQAWS